MKLNFHSKLSPVTYRHIKNLGWGDSFHGNPKVLMLYLCKSCIFVYLYWTVKCNFE